MVCIVAYISVCTLSESAPMDGMDVWHGSTRRVEKHPAIHSKRRRRRPRQDHNQFAVSYLVCTFAISIEISALIIYFAIGIDLIMRL